jgi:hypothetical protein
MQQLQQTQEQLEAGVEEVEAWPWLLLLEVR